MKKETAARAQKHKVASAEDEDRTRGARLGQWMAKAPLALEGSIRSKRPHYQVGKGPHTGPQGQVQGQWSIGMWKSKAQLWMYG